MWSFVVEDQVCEDRNEHSDVFPYQMNDDDHLSLLTQKSPTKIPMAYTTQGHHLTTLISLHNTFHDLPFDPHTSKRAQNRPRGDKSLKNGIKP